MNNTVKLGRQGNSTGLTLGRDILESLGWQRGQAVTLTVVGDHLEVRAADSQREQALASARRCFARYSLTLKNLAK